MKRTVRPVTIAIVIWCLAVLTASGVFAERPLDTRQNYPFLKLRYNRIYNDRPGLENFYGKLRALKTDRTGVVTIVHIGDSHIQADFMTAIVRERLQGLFGNAGRGLVFPYQVAKTNGPVDYRSYSNTVWKHERNASKITTLPMGISGYTLETGQEGAAVRLFFTQDEPGRHAFDKVTVFHDNGPGEFAITMSGGNTDATETHENTFLREDITSGTIFHLSLPTGDITLKTAKTGDSQHHARFYGISLENGSGGIIYHVAGVNGATFKDFNQSGRFLSQLKDLDPDLIIISLGTNDAMDRNFSSRDFYSRIALFAGSIRNECPGVDILFTMPPDFGRRRNGRLKKNILAVRSAVLAYSREKGHAFWDLYNVMGGQGSFARWKKHALARTDMVHFTKAGYTLQGSLFTDAVIKGFKNYGNR